MSVLPPDETIEEAVENEMDDDLLDQPHQQDQHPNSQKNSPGLQAAIDQNPHLGCTINKPASSSCYDAWRMEDSVTLSMIRLIDYCDRANSKSREFLDDLLKIISDEMRVRKFNPALAPTTKTVREKVLKRYGNGAHPVAGVFRMSSYSNPYLVSDHNALHSRRRDVLNCVRYCVRKNTIDLLNDRGLFGNLDNLVVNTTDPFLPYNGQCDEILGGSWHRNTIQRLKTSEHGFNERLEFKLDYIFYADKTGTCDNQRYPLEPFMFTFAIFRRKIRNNPRAWRPLGFIPDLESKSTYENKYIRSQNGSAIPQSYHCFLSFLLEGFAQIQNEGFVTWLRLGDKVKLVRIRPELAFIIGDGKSADMLTSRFGGHRANAPRISRACWTPQGICDDVTLSCRYITSSDELVHDIGPRDQQDSTLPEEVAHLDEYTQPTLGHCFAFSQITPDEVLERDHRIQHPTKPLAEIAQGIVKNRQALLRSNGFHPIKNAFLARCIRFGLDPRNIWGANPTDLMHAFQSGLLMYATKLAMDKLGNKRRAQLDILVDEILGGLRSSAKDTYPRFSFTKGFAKVSMITSDEWVGKLFVLLLVVNTDKGRVILKPMFDNQDIPLPENFPDLGLREMTRELMAKAKELDDAADEADRSADRADRRRTSGPKKRSRGRKAGTRGQNKKKANDNESGDEGNASGDSEADDDPGKKPKEGEEELLRKCSWVDFISLVEGLLCFHSWYKLDAVSWFNKNGGASEENVEHISASTRKLLAMVKCYMPRKTGLRWKIQKFHDITHLADDIDRFGSPKNFDAGPFESLLKVWAKLPALSCQTRGYNEFARQVGNRMYEFEAFSKAIRENRIDRGPPPKSPRLGDSKFLGTDQGTLKGSKYRVFSHTNSNGGALPITASLGKATVGYANLSDVVEGYLRHQKFDELEETKKIRPQTNTSGDSRWFDVYTECHFSVKEIPNTRKAKELRLRCHPNYMNEGPWYDWVIVAYEMEESDRIDRTHMDFGGKEPFHPEGMVPCKVLGFVMDGTPEGNIKAIVHTCDFQSFEEGRSGSVLIESWRLSYYQRNGRHNYLYPFIDVVDLESIHDIAFVVEEYPGIHGRIDLGNIGEHKHTYDSVLLVRSREEWGSEFIA